MYKKLIFAILLLANSNAFAGDFSVGLGLGIPYGLLGFNMNYQINETFDITGALGLGYGLGARLHPFESNRKFRFTAYYGTNAIILVSNPFSTEDELERFQGINFGFGYGSLSDGWDVDLIYSIVSDDLKDRITELESLGYSFSGDSSTNTENSFSISFGYHW